MSFSVASFEKRADQYAAQVLMRNALVLQAAHKRNLSKANPPPRFLSPAKRGQFPKARTFNLRDAVAIEPRSLAVIEQTGIVRVGVLVNAAYGEYLKANGWKGIIDTHEQLKSNGAYR